MVISLNLQLRLITLTSTLINLRQGLNITKTSSNDCLISFFRLHHSIWPAGPQSLPLSGLNANCK